VQPPAAAAAAGAAAPVAAFVQRCSKVAISRSITWACLSICTVISSI
jgi:hypothetical protein